MVNIPLQSCWKNVGSIFFFAFDNTQHGDEDESALSTVAGSTIFWVKSMVLDQNQLQNIYKRQSFALHTAHLCG